MIGPAEIEEFGPVSADDYQFVKLCASQIFQRVPASIELDDLIQVGLMGLADARRKYDPSRKNKFKTYAEFRIRGAILDHLRDCDFVPRSVRDKKKSMDQATAVLEQRLGRKPEHDELADEMKLSADKLYEFEQLTAPTRFLSSDEMAEWGRGDRRSLLDVITGGNTAEEKVVNLIHHKRRLELVAGYVKRQNPRTRIILDLYWFQGIRLKPIGHRLGICETRVSQIVTKHTFELERMLRNYELGLAA